MIWEALLAPIAVIGGWSLLMSLSKSDERQAKRQADVTKALEYIDTCQEVIRRSKPIAALASRQASLPLDVVHLLFEVKRRELKDTADQMFTVKVWGYGGPNPSTFISERYDYKTGKTKIVRKHTSLRLALSPEAKGLFTVTTQPIRGGSIWKGLRLTDEGLNKLMGIVAEVKGVADRAA